MATYYSGQIKDNNTGVLETQAITTTSTIVGTNILWDITTAAAPYTITVGDYVKEQFDDHFVCDKPCMKIRCSVNCSVQNVTISYNDSTGAAQTYVFNTDCSTIPKYLVLRTLDHGLTGYQL